MGLPKHSERRPVQKNGCVLSNPRTVPKHCLNLDSIYQPPTKQILLGFPAAKPGGPRGPRQGCPPALGSPPPERAAERHRDQHPLHNRGDCSQRPHSLKCLPFCFTISQEMRGQGISIPIFPSGQDQRGPVVFPVTQKKQTKNKRNGYR